VISENTRRQKLGVLKQKRVARLYHHNNSFISFAMVNGNTIASLARRLPGING
jgi:hypothetical protein